MPTNLPKGIDVKQIQQEIKETLREVRRPAGYRRRSTAPFYRERFAVEIKKILDDMIADPEKSDKMFFYSEWKGLYTPNSLYLYIYWSIRYLLEYMDPDETYRKFMETVGIQREKSKGIRLFYYKDVKEGQMLRPTAHTVKKELPRWRQQMEDFIATATEGQFLNLEHLSLSDDEVHSIEDSFLGVTGIEASITNNSIKLLKITL